VSAFLKRWWWALLVVAIVLGLLRLRFDVDVLDLLPGDEPTVQGLKLYQQHFTNARELIVTLRARDADTAEKLAGELAARLRRQTNLVAEVTWQAPWMERPDQLGELMAWLWFNQPPADFAALTNRLVPDQLKATLEETREILATSMSPMDLARRSFDPFNLLSIPALTNFSGISMDQGQMFASTNGTYHLLYLQSAVDLTSYRECEDWLRAIQGVVAELQTGPSKDDWNGAAVRYTGRPVFVEEIATSMQHDMSHSVGATSTIIAILFWLTHRRWRPMLWLLALLALILFATLALGALLLGTISVVALGFAAVLLGLAVDYAVVHYQEALAHPQMTVPEIRRAIAPSILWAAITTMSAFLVLNFGGLPGLGQLGSLVAIGIALSALVMVMIYLPPLFPDRRQPRPNQPKFPWWSYFVAPLEPVRGAGGSPAGSVGGGLEVESGGEEATQSTAPRSPATSNIQRDPSPQPSPLRGEREKSKARTSRPRSAFMVTAIVFLTACAILCFHRPGLDRTGNALQPQSSEAQAAIDEMTAEMGLPPQPFWLIVPGRDEAEVYQRLIAAEKLLNVATANHLIGHYLLPDTMWPRAEFQAANRATAAVLGEKGPLLRDAALGGGFNTNALLLSDEMVRTWAKAAHSTSVIWPTNRVSEWLLKRFVARTPDECLVMGLVYPATNKVDDVKLLALSTQLAQNNALLSGWGLLGNAVLKRVESRMWALVVPMVVLVLLSLWFAFRRATEILLGLAVLGLSSVGLLATMVLTGWTWNLMNLMALPLILGTGVDYTIFIQLALRRHGGDLPAVQRSVGRALMLCGGTAVAGFGSLAFSSNLGMASLGRVCAVGIGANMLISVFLLPAWWSLFRGGRYRPSQPAPQEGAASPVTRHVSPVAKPAIYRAGLWRLGSAVVRSLPAGFVKGVAMLLADVYWLVQRQGREVVVQNFLPVFKSDRPAAEKSARAAHRKFAAKLVDLWRVESGEPVRNWLTNNSELEIIHAARRRGKGTLFITLHLGNWEHGGLLLHQLGIRLTVLTQAEPADGLTEMRKAARARYGVDTLIIGDNGFAFVEVIKQLQAGADMAVSLDRPPERGGVPVEFFGRPFEASPAAAELARASGCAIIGVTIVRRPDGYAVKVLPEFVYDRRALGNREARRELTQQILRAFEPEIRENIDQWYQFTPIWPKRS
jgi:predicted RND superfamily exporter protein/lauroyl/myristoyl acyltransferase